MTSLHIGNNSIPIESMIKIIAIVEAKPAMKVLCAVPFRDKAITKLDVSGQNLGLEGALVVTRYLENNTVLKELDISRNYLKPPFAKAFAVGLRANGALTKLTISGDFHASNPVTIQTFMTRADFSSEYIGASGAIMLAAFLPKCP